MINKMMNQKLQNEELERISLEEFRQASKMPAIMVLDNVRSALNIGSVFRTADAFLMEAIFICGISATPPNKEIEKTALGATKSVEWKYFNDTIEAVKELKANGYKVFAVEQAVGSQMLNEISLAPKSAFVFGNEVNGVSQEVIDICDAVIEIPQAGTKHSLNVSVSAGLIMWEFFRTNQEK
jgi:23S rRNA (guanosine2251-2'-O)-methyltransferase